MRVYARYTDAQGVKKWTIVETGLDGSQDSVYIVNLIQVLLLNLGESPFYANYGIPAVQSVFQQIAPDYYVSRTQQQFSRYFSSLIIAKIADLPPTYRIDILTHQGIKLTFTVPMLQLSQRPLFIR